MTAEDVAWTFNLVSPDDFQEWNLWNYCNMVDEAVAVDDYTVELHLSEPDPLVEHYGPWLFVLPKDYYEKVGPEGFAEQPIGTGPFDFPCRNDYVKAAEVCQAVASMFGEVGIPVQVQVMDAGDYTQESLDKTLPPLSYTGHGGSSAFIGVRHYQSVVSCEGGSPNWSGYYCDPEIDELIEQAQSSWAADRDRAVSLIEGAEQLFHEKRGLRVHVRRADRLRLPRRAELGAASGRDGDPGPGFLGVTVPVEVSYPWYRLGVVVAAQDEHVGLPDLSHRPRGCPLLLDRIGSQGVHPRGGGRESPSVVGVRGCAGREGR